MSDFNRGIGQGCGFAFGLGCIGPMIGCLLLVLLASLFLYWFAG